MSQEEVAKLFADARSLRSATLREVGEASGVHHNTVSQVERWGIYDGMRALDLFKLAVYYGIDIYTIVSLSGLSPDVTTPDKMQPIVSTISSLSASDQEYVIGVLDVLLRGLRRRS